MVVSIGRDCLALVCAMHRNYKRCFQTSVLENPNAIVDSQEALVTLHKGDLRAVPWRSTGSAVLGGKLHLSIHLIR